MRVLLGRTGDTPWGDADDGSSSNEVPPSGAVVAGTEVAVATRGRFS